MEKDLETSAKWFSLLKDHFVGHQDFLTIVVADWDKNKVQHAQIGEKIIQLDNRQEERLTLLMSPSYQELAMKEEALAKLHVVVQETKEAKQPSIATREASSFLEPFSRSFR